MTYSVWNPGTHKYTYYNVQEPHADDVPTPKCRGKSKLGCAPGQIAWTLPAGAVLAGYGEHARGVVVHPGAGGGALGEWTDTPLPAVLIAGALVLGWRALK